jgi:hypothetical protein
VEEKGFHKTECRYPNENYDYEVWQKEFPAGEINLGIMDLDLHRVVYFVTIGSGLPEIRCQNFASFPASWKVDPRWKRSL